ncbi:MAG: sigma-70 family RNA polymerase sigma factor [Clostridiales bacterium]|nr:sigma-70 family RNA polymerase sigma factor [Clostridiales bacterium]
MDKCDENSSYYENIENTFDSFCKKVLRNEAIDIMRSIKSRSLKEVNISELTWEEKNKLGFYENYFVEEEPYEDKSFYVAGRIATSKMLMDALQKLPEEKQKIILQYYYDNMSDVQIANHSKLKRSTVQRRRKNCIKIIKKYLEENLNEKRKQ